MKIAVVTDDEKTISEHLGRARGFVVVTAENRKVTSREMRTRNGGCEGHARSDAHDHDHGSGGHQCGTLVEMIADCQVVLAHGMGGGMHRNLLAAGIRPVFTELSDIGEAVSALLDGRLSERQPKLCH